jgi:hypothetical protein
MLRVMIMGPSTMIILQVCLLANSGKKIRVTGRVDVVFGYRSPCDLTLVPVCSAITEPQSYAGAIRHRAY